MALGLTLITKCENYQCYTIIQIFTGDALYIAYKTSVLKKGTEIFGITDS